MDRTDHTTNGHDRDDTPRRRTSRRSITAGATAGLLGGAAIGLVVGVPGLTSAANDDGDGTPVAGLVQQTDETDPGNGDVPPDVRPGERLRDALQDLVDDGTLTAEQADAVATHLAEQRPERGDGPGRRGPGGVGSRIGGVMSEAVTDLLGLTPAELREQLRDGATLAEVAEAQGVGTEALVDEIVGEIEERIALGVENGRLDQVEADEKLAELEERIAEAVENGRPGRAED